MPSLTDVDPDKKNLLDSKTTLVSLMVVVAVLVLNVALLIAPNVTVTVSGALIMWSSSLVWTFNIPTFESAGIVMVPLAAVTLKSTPLVAALPLKLYGITIPPEGALTSEVTVKLTLSPPSFTELLFAEKFNIGTPSIMAPTTELFSMPFSSINRAL